MFEIDPIRTAVELQEQSYEMLRWVSRRMIDGELPLDSMHEAMSMGDAAEEWVTRHYASIPPAVRPRRDAIRPFATLFASYLSTSFEIKNHSLRSSCGCYCAWCRYVVSAPHLAVRRPSKKAGTEVRTLKLLASRALADDLELPFLDAELGRLTSEAGEVATAVSWLAYHGLIILISG